MDDSHIYDEYPDPPPVPTLTAPMSVEEMELLLASSLVKLSPTELKHARYGSYPIFRDNARYCCRDSFLFDEIPFGLEQFNRYYVRNGFRVYYHDDKIDWGGLKGWDVPSTRNNSAEGLVIIDRKRGYKHCLEGRLCFIPPDEKQEFFNEALNRDSDDEEQNESQDEYMSEDSECTIDHYDDDEYDSQEDEYLSEEDSNVASHSGAEVEDEDEDEQQSYDESMENNEEASEEESEMGSEHSENSSAEESDGESYDWNEITERYKQKMLSDWTLFHFDELHFKQNQDSSYRQASWYASGCECDFGIISSQDNGQEADDAEREDADANDGEREDGNTVTLFIANESMAFARGDRQHFVSLERPNNYGIECNSHYDNYYRREFEPSYGYVENDMHRMNVLQRMQAYRSTTWICKLCPNDMNLPDDAAHLIWEYWQTGPPPYLFVNKGDLLLLARKEEVMPDPDLSDIVQVTVTREHVVLARLLED